MEVVMGQAWSPLEAAARFVAQARLDYASFLEEMQEAPPVAFAERGDLEAWIGGISDSSTIEPFGTGDHAFRVHGQLRKGGYFDQIWAEARYRSYRNLILRTANQAYGETDLAGVDADHVVARTILCDAPKAWIAIFPVYSSSNQGFGRIEKLMPKFDSRDRLVRLTPAAAFKILNGRMVSDRIHLDHAMKDIRGQLQASSTFVVRFLAAMYADLVQYVSEPVAGCDPSQIGAHDGL